VPESATEDRLRIRHDVVFAKTGDGVLIRHSGGGFLLRGNSIYEWLTALSPFLDGTRSENELVSDLDESKAGMIHNLLDALRERNVVSEVSGRVIGDDDSLAPFRSQIAYIDHYVGHGVRRFERFRSARIRVDGQDSVSDSIRKGLLLNGLESLVEQDDGVPDSELDLRIVCALDGDAAHVAAATKSVTATPLLPVVRWGDVVVIGPLCGPDEGDEWTTSMTRLTRNGNPMDGIAFWRSVVTGRPAMGTLPFSPAHASMVGLMVAYEAFKALTGALSPETEHGVLCFDLATGDTSLDKILPDPFTGGVRPGLLAADLDLTEPEPEPVSQEKQPSQATTGPGDGILDDNRTPVERETMAKYFSLIGPHAGIVTNFDDEHIEQSPVKVSTALVSTDKGIRSVRGYAVDTLGDARKDAVERGVLEYAAALGPVPRETQVEGRVISADRVTTWTGLVNDDGAESHGGWVGGRTLGGETVLVPAAAVYARSTQNAAGMFEHTGAREGAGVTPEAAVIAGLRSAWEYAALQAALRTGEVHSLAPSSVEPTAMYLEEAASILKLEYERLLLPQVGPEPVVVIRESTGPEFAIASAPTVDSALAVALLRLLGRRQQPEGVASHDQLLVKDLDPRALVPMAPSDRDEVLSHFSGDWLGAGVAAGFETVLVDITPPDVASANALTAVRVLLTRTS